MSNRTTLESHLEFAAGIEFKQGEQVLLKEIKFQRRTFLVAVPLLPVPVPVVYRPVLSIYIGADSKIASTMTLSAEHKVTYHRGLIYDGQNWNKFKYADTESWEFDPSISVRFDARAYFAPRLEIEFYGVLGPYVEASVYMRFELNPTADHWWKLAAGMEAAVGIEFEVLGDVLLGYKKEILTVPEWTIAQAESPPAPTPMVTASQARVFGPSSGSLPHEPEDGYIEEYEADVSVTDLVAEATFYNPYSSTEGSWNYGLLYRRTSWDTLYAILVESDGDWKHKVFIDGDWDTIEDGSISDLRTGADQSNHLRIIVIGDSGEFYVNGQLIASLDMSGPTEAGDVGVATGMVTGDEIEGEVTRFEDFTVWSLD